MIRRFALTTLLPCVALYLTAACLGTSMTSHASRTLTRSTAKTLLVAKRSGYIVASS